MIKHRLIKHRTLCMVCQWEQATVDHTERLPMAP